MGNHLLEVYEDRYALNGIYNQGAPLLFWVLRKTYFEEKLNLHGLLSDGYGFTARNLTNDA